MSAPDTKLEKQKRRHLGPLVGMALAVLVGAGAILYWLFGAVEDAPSPADRGLAQQERDASPSDPAPVRPPAIVPPDVAAPAGDN